MTTRRERERGARRAIAWGAGIVVVGFVVGAVVALVPVASGWAWDPPFGLALAVAVGASLVGIVGFSMVVYGLVQLARSKPPPEQIEREREHRRRGPFDRDQVYSS